LLKDDDLAFGPLLSLSLSLFLYQKSNAL